MRKSMSYEITILQFLRYQEEEHMVQARLFTN